MVMTVHQGASGSLMEKEDWLLLIQEQCLTHNFLGFMLLSKSCCYLQKSEVCPKTRSIFENCQKVPLGWKTTWVNNRRYVVVLLCRVFKASFSGFQAIPCSFVLQLLLSDIQMALRSHRVGFSTFSWAKKQYGFFPYLHTRIYLKFC